MNALRVLHIIPSLEQGGAESLLASLVQETSDRIDNRVLTLTASNNFFGLDPRLIVENQLPHGKLNPAIIRQLRTAVKELEPDVVHAWMYHANLCSSICLWGRAPLVWSVHNSTLPVETAKRATRLVNSICARISRFSPSRIIYVAEFVREMHEAQGYDRSKGIVIPNGIDLKRFDFSHFPPRPAGAGIQRPIVVGAIGRYSPEKGAHFLVDVIATHPMRNHIELVFVGRDFGNAPALSDHLRRVGLLGQTRLLEAVRDIERIYASLDVFVLPSFSEAMPLTVLEAMAMKVPVCASRVGGIDQLQLAPEFLFPPKDAAACSRALSAAFAEVIASQDKFDLRDVIVRNFDIQLTAQRYLALYQSLAPKSDDRK